MTHTGAFDPSLASPGSFWKMLSRRPVSVPIVAAEDDTGPAGLLALSVSHVSAEPPTMSVAIGKSTRALATIVRSGCFAISYLPRDASETAEIFGGRRQIEGAARFEHGAWARLVTGAPVFRRAILALDCRLEATFEFHETVIACGIIQAHAIDNERAALMSHGGKYSGWQA